MRVCRRFRKLSALETTHGDMKAGNLIQDDKDVFDLVDLDKMVMHSSKNRFKRKGKEI